MVNLVEELIARKATKEQQCASNILGFAEGDYLG